jgi:hypothetical protein
MAKVLTRLRIDEVSSVDRGAGDGVKIMLMKRDEDVEAYLKRTFDAAQRRSDAKSGAALPDGSFPIENKSDLHNAMRAIGRAKDPGKARAHIRARARALGLESELSDSFKKGETMSVFGKLFGKRTSVEDVHKATFALAESVSSIVDSDESEEAKSAALAKSFEQFNAHLTETLGSVVVTKTETEESGMDIKAIAKALGLAETATEADITKAIAKQKHDAWHSSIIAKAGFTADELAFYAKASQYDEEEDDKPEMSDDDKGKGKKKKRDFRLASHEDRTKAMKGAEPALPEYVTKMIADNAEMAAIIKDLRSKDELVALGKRAVEAGLPEGEAATIQKAYRGDKEAVDKLLGFVKQHYEAAKAGGVFKELGSSTGDSSTGDSAIEQLNKLAAARLKAEPALGSLDKAFAKVYEDPANRALAKRERTENRPHAS